MTQAPTLMIAAPASGSGKTVLTLSLLRHFRNQGSLISSFKVGPDFIDPAFHLAASGRTCLNLDCWSMHPATLARLSAAAGDGVDLVIGEGVMGLFDGATDGTGSTADLAALAGWPVVLVVDVRGQGTSAAATVSGFAQFRADVRLAGVIFNRVGGEGHARILRDAMAPLGIPVLGCVPRDPRLHLPDRHLGLVQAGELDDLDAFLDAAAAVVGAHVDTDALRALARPGVVPGDDGAVPGIPPLGQRIAVARDTSFAFAYPFVLDGWRGAGAEIVPFSALADEAPDGAADAVYLPGGYPELHAGRLAGNAAFLDGLRATAARGGVIYGECGGYMVLGEGLVDGDERRHEMAGLVALETSFARRRLHLGYRQARLVSDGPLGAGGTEYRGHEFHYATILSEPAAEPLFQCRDARNDDLGPAGCRRGNVMGSFVHLVDAAFNGVPRQR
jgi:cobyrinic acid a,c-diamide synthase